MKEVVAGTQGNRRVETPFVGRKQELAVLRRMMRDALAGRGAVALIAGDHGVGKTRLALEATDAAARAGLTVLWTRGRDDEGAPPYWPWTEALTRYVEAVGKAHALRLMGAEAREMAALVPPLHGRGAADAEPPSREARYRLFMAVSGFLRRAAAESPLAIVLDDLHYCDDDSLRLLEVLAGDLRDSRLAVVATCVDRAIQRNPVLSTVIGTLARGPSYHDVPIGNLASEDVERLLEHGIGAKRARTLAGAVCSRTQGNALFVAEVARTLGRDGVKDSDWEREAAGSVAVLVSRRAARLSRQARDLLEAAAVLGREFETDLLSAIVHLDAACVRGLLAEAVAHGFAEQLTPDRYRFRHDIVQQAIAALLLPDRACRLHRDAAESLEALRGPHGGADLARLARHFRAAGAECAAKAAGYARDAGLAAIAAHAYDAALRHFEDALGFVGIHGAVRAELELLRAQALFAATRFAEATAPLEQAFDLFVALDDIPRAVASAVFAFYPAAGEMLPRAPLKRIRERALALVPPDSHEAAALLCELGETYSQISYVEADGALSRALELARKHRDPSLEARVWFNRSWAERRNLHHPADTAAAERGLQIAREIGDRNLELLSGGLLALWQVFYGDCGDAEQLVRRLSREAGAPRTSMWSHYLQRAETALASWRCRLEEHARALRHGRWISRPEGVHLRHGRGSARVLLEPPVAHLRHMEQNPQLFLNPDEKARRALEVTDFSRALHEYSQLGRARELAHEVLETQASPLGRLQALAALAHAAVMEGDRTALAEACGGELLTAPNQVVGGILLDRLRGEFAAELGHAEQARCYFESADALSRSADFVWEIAWNSLLYASFLLRQGERARARRLAEDARRVGVGLSMTGFECELTDLLCRLDGGLPDGLTAREVEVVRLVSAGQAAKQVAAEMSISYHTVVNHLRAIYRKTGTRGRVELARYAVRHNLTAS